MEETLKITNVFSDPTRYKIYEYLFDKRNQPVTVIDVAEQFNIHPNVARIHLTKLEEIKVVKSDFERTGKGGRPSRIYQLTDKVIELNFPHRDYKLLSKVAIDTLINLGDIGKRALFDVGYNYGHEMMETYHKQKIREELTIEQKIALLEDTSKILGMYPKLTYLEDKNEIHFEINNCPFKEVANQHQATICQMHYSFIQGMFESVFDNIELIETENLYSSCSHCKYVANLAIV